MSDQSEGIPKGRSLRRNVASAFFGNSVFAFSQWIILAAVAKLSNPEQVGYVALATALVTPIYFFAAMSMREAHSVDDLKRFSTEDYFALRWFNTLLAAVTVGGCLLLFYRDVSFAAVACIVSFAIVKSVGTQSNLNYGMFQRQERLDWVSNSLILRGMLGASTFAIAFYFSRSVWISFLVEALAWLLVLITYDHRRLRELSIKNRFSSLWKADYRNVMRLFWWMLPLGVSGFSINLSASTPRLVAENYVAMAEFGVFGAIAYVNSALLTVSNSIGSASSRRLARLYQDGKQKRFTRLTCKLVLGSLLLGGTLVVGSHLFGRPLLTILYDSEYAARSDLLTVVLLATALQITAAPLQFAMTAGHAFSRRLFVNVVSLICVLGIAAVVIPTYGITGAAWTMAAGALVRLLLSIIVFLLVAIKIPSGLPREELPLKSATEKGALS